MRVLETKVVTTYSMGKKNKHKLRKSKENEASDSSEEIADHLEPKAQVRGCQHVNKAINFNAMKKGLAKQGYGECAGCAKEVSSKRSEKLVMDNLEGATSLDFIEEVEPTLWVCLQCGHQGCGRNSPEKHALKHYETPRSSQHNVCINTSCWSVWCYECDDELQPEKYKKVSECLDHIKKLACVPVVDSSGQGKNSSGSGGPSGGETGSNKNRSHTGLQKVLGLSNLGNTCFFNAVLQNLIQTYSLENLLRERKRGQSIRLKGSFYMENESCSSSDEGENMKIHKDLPTIEISVSDPGPLTQALVVFLQDASTSSKSGIVSPSALFGQVCKKAPRFKGMQQQDSHELLRYLMDNMKTEEIKRGQTGILKHFKLSENANPKKVDEETKTRVKVYGSEVKHTFVESLFGGQLISTVVCEECKYISQILEPFLDLSLPVTEEKPQRPNQGHGVRKRDSTSEMKEDVAESLPAKDEKISKHQSKKMKKQRKRDLKRKGKGSLKKCEGKEKEGEGDCDGEKEDGGEGEEDKEEEEEEEEEEEDGEGSKREEQQERDASDADVEDNLESDTYSRAASDCVFTNGTGGEDNSSPNSAPDKQLDHTIPQPQENNPRPSAAAASFTVETEIDNYSVENPPTCPNSVPRLTKPVLNGAVTGVDFTDSGREELSVSYTLQNGRLTESHCNAADTESVTNYTVHQRTLCNGIGEKIVKDDNDNAKRSAGHIHCNGSIEGDIKTDSGIVNDFVNDNIKDKSLKDKSVKELTKGISEISVTENGVDSAASSLPNGVNVEMDKSAGHTGEEKKSSELPDISKLQINESSEAKRNGGKTETELKSEENRLNDRVETAVRTQEAEGKHGDTGAEASSPQCKTPTVSQGNQSSRASKWEELQYEGQRRSLNTLADRYHASSLECSVESCLHQFTAAELLTGQNKFGCKNCTKLKFKNNPNKEKKESVYSCANKQYLIFQPPAVLTLHLKRFEQVGYSSRKVNRHVDFPFVLDIAPYCSSLTQGIKAGQKKILYSLYGVVEHSGRLSSGHYTAYVKVRPNMGTFNNFLNVHNVTLTEYLHKYAQNVINGDTHDVDSSDFINTDSLIPPGRWYHISDSRVNEVTEASVEKAQAYLLFYERIY